MQLVVDQSSGCPHHGQDPTFQKWLQNGLLCSAGKREFKLDRYHVAHVANGADFGRELDHFRSEVACGQKTGFFAVVSVDTSNFTMAEDELWLLGTIMRDAGLSPSVAALINGETIAIPFQVPCPVTGKDTIYEFFPVAFCRNAANPDDLLFDPALSAPFTAINTTSDAFAFAMLVRDQSVKTLGRLPSEVKLRQPLQAVMTRAVDIWQGMSVNTIKSYNRVAGGCPHRTVQLSEDRRFWLAPHNDPVFAELKKNQHAHEMPRIYASRLCEKWLASLFDSTPATPSRDGQSGGRRLLHNEEIQHELHQF